MRAQEYVIDAAGYRSVPGEEPAVPLPGPAPSVGHAARIGDVQILSGIPGGLPDRPAYRLGVEQLTRRLEQLDGRGTGGGVEIAGHYTGRFGGERLELFEQPCRFALPPLIPPPPERERLFILLFRYAPLGQELLQLRLHLLAPRG